eukprot:1162080-Pelagomonas_calceolata.AAC.13
MWPCVVKAAHLHTLPAAAHAQGFIDVRLKADSNALPSTHSPLRLGARSVSGGVYACALAWPGSRHGWKVLGCGASVPVQPVLAQRAHALGHLQHSVSVDVDGCRCKPCNKRRGHASLSRCS